MNGAPKIPLHRRFEDRGGVAEHLSIDGHGRLEPTLANMTTFLENADWSATSVAPNTKGEPCIEHHSSFLGAPTRYVPMEPVHYAYVAWRMESAGFAAPSIELVREAVALHLYLNFASFSPEAIKAGLMRIDKSWREDSDFTLEEIGLA